MKLNLGCGPHQLEGFENLDLPWRFEDGLPYTDASAEGITVSHALMYVRLADWPFVFSEFARVLEPGGVVRITEDATDDLKSSRFGGFDGAVTLTSRRLVGLHFDLVGLVRNYRVDTNLYATAFRDDSLIQEHHGKPPKVFHVEGVKP